MIDMPFSISTGTIAAVDSGIRTDFSISSVIHQPKSNSSKSSLRRFLCENQISFATSMEYLEIEREADSLMLVSDDSFYSSYARFDHFKSVGEKYSKAASLAEKMGDFKKGASLRLKEALVRSEKLDYNGYAISILHRAIPLYKSQNQLHEVDQLYKQIIAIYDKDYHEIKAEGDLFDLAPNRIGKAGIYEELNYDPILWQELYKEAGDLLLQDDPSILYDRDAGLSNHTVAAMCYEKVPEYMELAKNIYKDVLEEMGEGFNAYLEERAVYDWDEPYIRHCWSVQTLAIAKGLKFLALKAENRDVFIKIAELEIQCLEDSIYHRKLSPEELDRLICGDSDLGSIQLEHEEHPSFKVLGLYYISCHSLITYFDEYDPIKAEPVRLKLAELESYLKFDQRKNYKELLMRVVEETPSMKGMADIFHELNFPTKDISVAALIDLFSSGVRL